MMSFGGLINRTILANGFFSFDQIKVFNMFRDYPHELTEKQKDILIVYLLPCRCAPSLINRGWAFIQC